MFQFKTHKQYLQIGITNMKIRGLLTHIFSFDIQKLFFGHTVLTAMIHLHEKRQKNRLHHYHFEIHIWSHLILYHQWQPTLLRKTLYLTNRWIRENQSHRKKVYASIFNLSSYPCRNYTPSNDHQTSHLIFLFLFHYEKLPDLHHAKYKRILPLPNSRLS